MKATGNIGVWTIFFGLGLVAGGLGVHTWQRGGEALPGRRVEATVFVPLVDNSDQVVSEEKWHAAVEPLITRFGGATLGTPIEGSWRDSRQKMRREPVRPVVVSFEAHDLADFRRTLNEVGRRLGQEVMYVRFDEPRVEFLPVKLEGE